MKINTLSHFLCVIILLLSIHISGQELQPENESQSKNLRAQPVFKNFPYTKLVDISYEPTTSSDYRIKRDGTKYESGKLDEQKLRVNVLVPIYKKPNKFELLAGASYKLQTYSFKDVSYENVDIPYFTLKKNTEAHYFGGNLTGIYYTKLFSKPLILNANLLVDGSEEGYERLLGSFTATLAIHRSEKTNFAVGVYYTNSNSRLLPVFPIIAYQHQIGDSPWVIDGLLPRSLYLRRMIGANSRLSTGILLDPTMSFIYPKDKDFNRVYTFNKLDAKLDIKYEQLLNDHFAFNINGGISQPYKGVFRRKNDRDNFADLTQDMNVYVNVGASYKLK